MQCERQKQQMMPQCREVERVGPEGNPRWSRTRGDNCSRGWREAQARRQSCHWLSHIVAVCACVCLRVLPGLIVVCNCALCVALSLLLLLLLCSWCCCWCWVMAASNQLINIAWAPQWKRLKNNALRDAKWFNNANETRGETKAAQNTLRLSPATPPFSIRSCPCFLSPADSCCSGFDINAHLHSISIMWRQCKLKWCLPPRCVYAMCHQKAIAQRFTKLTHNLHDNGQGDLHPPFSLLLPLPLSLSFFLALSSSSFTLCYSILLSVTINCCQH